jgi:hypothetical protein
MKIVTVFCCLGNQNKKKYMLTTGASFFFPPFSYIFSLKLVQFMLGVSSQGRADYEEFSKLSCEKTIPLKNGKKIQ